MPPGCESPARSSASRNSWADRVSDLLDPEGEPAPDAKLIEVAAQIAEGGAIDWDAIEREHPGEAEVVQGLKRMERVLRAQRDARSTQPPVNPIGVWGHLQLVEILARGSFGEVYRAYDPQLQIDVALKLFHPAGSPGTHTPLEDCLKEARQMAPYYTIMKLPGVIDAVFFVPRREAGAEVERLAAFVVAPGSTRSQLLAGLRAHMDPVFLPRPLIFVDTLPRDGNGKMLAATLQDLLAKHSASAVDAALDSTQVEARTTESAT